MKAPLAWPLGKQVRKVWILGGQQEQTSTTMKTMKSCLSRGNVSQPLETFLKIKLCLLR